MTLILSNEEVEDLLDMPLCLDALEQAYIDYSEGRAIMGHRSDMVSPTAQADSVYQLKMMGAVLPGQEVGVVRINSDILSWPKKGGKQRRVKTPLAPGGRWVGLVLLFSTKNGEPVAIFPDGVIQRARVGATSGLGVKYLARADADIVGLIGSGWQAGAQVLAVTAVRDIKQIRCYSMTKANREAFCREMAAETGVEMVSVDSAEKAVRGADVVLLATNSDENIVMADWVEPGMHLGTIRDGDIEPAAIQGADVVFTHDPSGINSGGVRTSHGIKIPDQKREASRTPELQYLNDAPILADLIAGKVTGRESADQITCFLNFRGLGLQFAAAGMAIYRSASAAGRGRELPTEWFTEDVCS